jgi:hypothetical protein
MGEHPETQAAKKAAISTSIHRIHSPPNNQPTNHPTIQQKGGAASAKPPLRPLIVTTTLGRNSLLKQKSHQT